MFLFPADPVEIQELAILNSSQEWTDDVYVISGEIIDGVGSLGIPNQHQCFLRLKWLVKHLSMSLSWVSVVDIRNSSTSCLIEERSSGHLMASNRQIIITRFIDPGCAVSSG